MNTAKHKIEMLEKRVSKAFGKKIYLLGTFEDGHNFWLEEPKWECGWYWGFGYVETYTNPWGPPARDIESHQHYDGLCFKKYEYYDHKKGCFQQGEYIHKLSDRPDVVACSLIEREQWILSDLMKMAYTLKKTAELYRQGNAHLTSHELVPQLKRPDREKEINEIELPAIFAQIEKLLTPA